jgi:glycosyltransferase involved in cell wall biosynthesis
MKIMMVHNQYQQAGGEDTVFELESELLESHGHEVRKLVVDNDHIQGFPAKLKAALSVTYSDSSRLLMMGELDKFDPNVVHVHNFFPVLTPSIFNACKQLNVPVVHTLHNYRLICPSGILMIDGEIYERSVTGSAYWSVLKKAYRNSYLGTLAVARMVEYHKKFRTWHTAVSRFIALTQFAKDKFIEAGFPSGKITVKPNFICDPMDGQDTVNHDHRAGALFVGRLCEEKGIRTLMEAWRSVDYPLTVAGDGPLYNECYCSSGNINFVGNKSYKEISTLMNKAAFLVMPSEWYEGLPMVLVEAYAHGLPVIASDLGGLSELVLEGETGTKFPPGQSDVLASKACSLIGDITLRSSLGENARKLYERKYTPEKNYSQLIGLYEELADGAKLGR